MKPRVFLTGASGFIGRYVLREFLLQGWHVTVLIHKTVTPELAQLRSKGLINTCSGNVSNFADLEDIFSNQKSSGFEVIVHCAGKASDVGRRKDFRLTNLDSVKHLARLCMDTGVGRFVLVSSTDVYGMGDFYGESEDELPLEGSPVNPYPEFKVEAEKWLKSHVPAERYVLIRPGAVWGKDDLTITKRIVDFLQFSPWIVHFGQWKGNNRWPLAHVRNVAAAIFLASIDDRATGEAINILDSEQTTMEQFYREIAKVYFPEKSFKSICLPCGVIWPMAKFITLVSNLLNLSQPFVDPSHYALLSVTSNLDFSNQRFLELMERGGVKPVTFADGVCELEKI